MDTSNFNSKIDRLEIIIQELAKKQEAFIEKALLKLSLNSKEIYSSEEAAEFLSIEVKYIHQLTHQPHGYINERDEGFNPEFIIET